MLLNRYLGIVLVSTCFLQFGIWVRNIAILLYVVDRTNGDGFAVSMISVAEFLPIFVFSFIGGAFADRWNPKATMIWCDLLSALSILCVLLAFQFGTWKAIFFATLVSSILSQFSQPSGMKLFKLHVRADQIQAGMSIFQTVMAIFMITGACIRHFCVPAFWHSGMYRNHGGVVFTFGHRFNRHPCRAKGGGSEGQPFAERNEGGHYLYGFQSYINLSRDFLPDCRFSGRTGRTVRHFRYYGTPTFAGTLFSMDCDRQRNRHDCRRRSIVRIKQKSRASVFADNRVCGECGMFNGGRCLYLLLVDIFRRVYDWLCYAGISSSDSNLNFKTYGRIVCRAYQWHPYASLHGSHGLVHELGRLVEGCFVRICDVRNGGFSVPDQCLYHHPHVSTPDEFGKTQMEGDGRNRKLKK